VAGAHLEDLLYTPELSLIDQSLHSQLSAGPRTGTASGLLVRVGETPRVFHSVETTWNNRNLRDIAAHIESPLVFAHISVLSGSPVQ
jgi:glutamine amidotransferase